jgi:hypothetical protein
MSRTVRTLLALVIAFLTSTNAVGAGAWRDLAAGCCGEPARGLAAGDALAPCHDEDGGASLACTAADAAADDAAAAAHCGDDCRACGAQHGSVPAFLTASTARAAAEPPPYEAPSHAAVALPVERPARLERPPSTRG